MKQFIKKCLEVSEEHRMSLTDLKEWDKNNPHENLIEGTMVFLLDVPELTKKQCSNQETKPVLGELTNRVASRSQSNFTHQTKSFREAPSASSNQPIKSGVLNKNTIDKNNNILIL